MASGLDERKYNRMFDIIDADGDGVIVKNDLRKLAHNVVGGIGRDSSAIEHEYLRAWDLIAAGAGADRDGQITRKQFHRSMARQADDDALIARTFRPAIEAEFGVLDTDLDGVVTKEEMTEMVGRFGVSPEAAGIGFDELDEDGDGFISFDEYFGAWLAYLTSGDPATPGSGLFGVPR